MRSPRSLRSSRESKEARRREAEKESERKRKREEEERVAEEVRKAAAEGRADAVAALPKPAVARGAVRWEEQWEVKLVE